jgi:farnesyl diphosphate synthase
LLSLTRSLSLSLSLFPLSFSNAKKHQNLIRYKVPEVGMVACNDYIVLESCLYRILSNHFKTEKYYAFLLDLFHETTHQTAYGQQLDVTVAPPGTVDLTRYTEDTYNRIVTFKTAVSRYSLHFFCCFSILFFKKVKKTPTFLPP